jgi:hypothetical protein
LLQVYFSYLTLQYKVLFKMKKEEDYLKDLMAIRSMMERSSRFMSLSGWAGVLAGIYALVGAYIAHSLFGFRPSELAGQAGFKGGETGLSGVNALESVFPVVWVAVAVLLLSLGTAFYLTRRRAVKTKEPVGRAASASFIANLSMPLVAGGALMLVLLFAGQVWLMIPLSLIFYGIAMFNAGNYTFRELKLLGAIEVVLGLLAALFPVASLLFWAAGFGLMHIIYGIVIHYKYQR